MRKNTLRYAVAAPAMALLIASASAVVAQEAPAAAPQAALARTADGHPDFSGVWDPRTNTGPRPADPRGICLGFNCGPNAVPAGAPRAAPTGGPAAIPAPRAAAFPKYRPEFLAKVAELNKNQVKEDPALRCGNPGLPRIGPPNKIIQTKNEMTMLYDDLNGSFWRVIPLDGRAHDKDAEESALGGSSVGKWEGDKLVIETVGFSDNTWLTDNGAFHSYNMKVVEELTPKGRGFEYKATIHDPEVLAEPWVKVAALNNVGGIPGQPVPCVEKSIDAMVGSDSYHPNARW